MSEGRSAPDLRGLEAQYEIRGELRGNGTARHYIGRTREDRAAEVAIVIASKADGGQTSDLAHYAADAQILAGGGHPAVPRVLDTRWLGSDTVAVISERVVGDTLDELLERGEKFPTPTVARILEDVESALDWARGMGVVHRGVTPDSLIFERGTGRVRLSFVPTPVPMTGTPDVATDARTIGTLAWAFLTGRPYARGETRSLGEVCPNLAARVIEATDKIIRSKDHADAPDVDKYLSILAAGDVLKQAEVELLAQKEEYDEAHRIELQKCDLQRQEVEQHAAEQASLLAGEREEFRRQIEDERAAIAAERAQFESMMNERKERFAAVRAELDQQRAEMERRVAELEKYRLEVEKVRDEALAAREEAKTAREDAKIASNRAAEAAAAHAAAVRAANEAIAKAANDAAARESAWRAAMAHNGAPPEGMPIAPTPLATPIPTAEEIEAMMDVPVDIPAIEPFVAPKLPKPPKAPKWDKFDAVDLDHTDEEAVMAGNGRRSWLVASGVGTLVLIGVAAVYGAVSHHTPASDTVRVGNSTVVPTAPVTQSAGIVPRGGFLTQSAGGVVTPTFAQNATQNATPNTTPSTTPNPASGTAAAAPGTASDSTTPLTQEQIDSIAAAKAARARRAAAREQARLEAQREEAARRKALQEITDSLNSPASTWNTRPVPRPDTIGRVRIDTVVRSRPDTALRLRPDTLSKR